eukprot:4419810-Heterocapsa_arctica.AAC.1
MRSCAEPSASTPRRARHAVCTWRRRPPLLRHRSSVLPSEPPTRRRSPVSTSLSLVTESETGSCSSPACRTANTTPMSSSAVPHSGERSQTTSA